MLPVIKKPILIIFILIFLQVNLLLFPSGGRISGVVISSRMSESGNDTALIKINGKRENNADEVRLKFPKKILNDLSEGSLPSGWEMIKKKGVLILSGKEKKFPLNLRLDLKTTKFSGKAGIEVLLDGKTIYKKKKVLIKRLPQVKKLIDFSNILVLPPLISLGDKIRFKPLDINKTPIGGKWKIGDITAEWIEGKKYYDLSLPYKMKNKMDLSVTYTDEYEVDLYGTLKYPDIKIIPMTVGNSPNITGVSPMVLYKDRICICGYFPDEKAGMGIFLDGRPLGSPVSSSSHILIFQLDGDVGPGVHRISGEIGSGYSGSENIEFEVIKVNGLIDRNKLWKGESTPLKLWLEGTEKKVSISLSNKTPQIISLDGGNDQKLLTSGGKENKIEKKVSGLTPGDFSLQYNLELSFCPCYEEIMKESEEGLYFENLYDDVIHDFREGRQNTNEGSGHRYDDLEQAKLKAAEALRLFTRAREKIDLGVENGDIGETSARLLRQYMSEYETRARNILTMKEETPLQVESVPDPVSSRPEEKPSAIVTDGWFEPVQSVWQDDDKFRDFSGKQLTKTSPGVWQAELKMVTGKRTLIFGIREDQRNRVKMMGTTNGTKLVKVKFRFKLIQGTTEKIIFTEREAHNYISLDGPIGPDIPWSASLMAGNGLPEFRSFTIGSSGSYKIECELLRENGAETGLKVIVNGQAIRTFGPNVKIVPVQLSSETSGYGSGYLPAKAQVLASEADSKIPLFYPLVDGGMSVTTDPLLDLRTIEPGTLATLWSMVPFTDTTENVRADALSAAMTQRFGTGASLTNGPKVYVLLSDHDFDLVRRGGRAAAYCSSQKLMVGRHDNKYTTVAHELIHSMPYLWSVTNMESNFGFNYHNDADHNNGNGVMIKSNYRIVQKDKHAVMGSDYTVKWISQGTYWHLLNEFRSRPDPELLLLRGYIAQDNGNTAGFQLPVYKIMGIADLKAVKPVVKNKWNIILKNAAGDQIGRYAINARWHVPDLDVKRKILSYNYRIPSNKEVSHIELYGPNGLLDKKTISVTAPVVKFTGLPGKVKNFSSDRKISIQWKGFDRDGDKLFYTLLYSPDKGNKWRILAMDTSDNSFTYKIPGHPKKIRFKIFVSDGLRSNYDEVGITIK